MAGKGLNREWDVPKRDLLDLERTAQAEKVEAAEVLVDAAEALAVHIGKPIGAGGWLSEAEQLAKFVRQAVRSYRIAAGQDTGDAA